MSDIPILYRFIATGPDSVISAFKSIGAAARESGKQASDSARATERALRPVGARGRAGADPGAAVERAAKRAADIEVREAKRAADARIREQTRAAQHVAAIRDRHFREEQRQEERAAAARARAADRTRSDRMRSLTGLGKDAALAGVGVGVSALGVVGQAAREGVQLQDIANRISINARAAGQGSVDASTLRREFEAAAIASPGIKATDVAAGVGGFVAKTGELGVARRFAGTFATTASATGASVEDISNAAADLFQKFDITSIEDMQSALAALTFQGKNGAFELKDAAAQFAKMSAAASRFGVSKGAEGVKVLGGLTQIARSATGSPEQAATAVEATFRQLIAKSGVIKGLGVDVFEKGSKSKTRDVRDVIVDTIAKAGGGQVKLQEIFGEEGIRGISPLISAFNTAKGAATGTEAERTAAGITAMREALAKAIDAPGDWSEVVKDAAQAQRSAGAQLDAAWESIKATVANEAVPALLKLMPAVTQLAESGIGPAIVVFQALVEAAGLVVDAFKIMGLITPKTMTPEQQLKKAQGELATFDKKAGIGAPTAEQSAERARLQAAVDAADAKAFTTSTVTTTTKGAGAGPSVMTADDFQKKYAEAGTYGIADQAKLTAMAPLLTSLAALDATGLTNFGGNEVFQKSFLGENAQQTKLREDFAAQEQSRATPGGADGDMRAAAAELKAAARALKESKPAGGTIVGDAL